MTNATRHGRNEPGAASRRIRRVLSATIDVLLGRVVVVSLENEIRDPDGSAVGTYRFALRRDRFGRRTHAVTVEGRLPSEPSRHVVGRAIAERWVKDGTLPV